MKNFKTLITLFLLVIGTSASWAEFKDFEIDLTKKPVVLPDNVESVNGSTQYNGEHGWADFVFKFTTSETVKITLQKCYYGANACVKLGATDGTVLVDLPIKQELENCNGEVSYIYVSDGTPKDLYVFCGDYCHYAKVEKVVAANNFVIDLMNESPVLPAGVSQIAHPANSNAKLNTGGHGWEWYAIEFYVDRDVDITIGGCQFQNGYFGYITDGFGNEIHAFNNNTCDGKFTYKYDKGPGLLKLYGGQYCPSIKVVSEATHTHSFTGVWTKTETHHYHACTAAGCDITDYSALTGSDALAVAYGAHDYDDVVSFDNYYKCKVCDYENETRKADAEAATKVIKLIAEIGKPENVVSSTEYEEKIGNARKAYDELTNDRKALVTNVDKLEAAERMYKALTPVDVPARIAIWNWEDADENSTIIAETGNINSKGEIQSDVPGLNLEVNVSGVGGSCDVVPAGDVYYASISTGYIKVPVRSSYDIVYIHCPSGHNNIYTIGGKSSTNLTIDQDGFAEYYVTDDDVRNGYAVINAKDETHFYQIKVLQETFYDVPPMITLNKEGWASFTCVMKTVDGVEYSVAMPLGAKAYVAVAVDKEYEDYGLVILKEVKHFKYGDGVFIHGAPYAEIFGNVVKAQVSPVENNLTSGCVTDKMLYPESRAYVIATNKVTGEAGFYHVNTALKVPGGRAYLYAPKGTKAKMLNIVFEDGEAATGIESVIVGAETEAPTVFYNLSGQMVGKDYKGIVIGNDGKKYVK